MIESDCFLDLRELMKDLEEGKVIHFDLIYVRANIGKHVVLASKLKFEFLVLLKQAFDDFILLILLFLHHQAVLHQATHIIADLNLLADKVI